MLTRCLLKCPTDYLHSNTNSQEKREILMDVAGGLSLVQTVIRLLGSPIWTEIESVLGVESQLAKLKVTMSTIQNVLLDAEVQERLHHGRRTNVEQGRLERLKEALYQADELFDKVTTLAHRKQLFSSNKFRKEVCLFFSCSNQLRSAFNWSREIKKIREGLDDIVKDHQHDSGLRQPIGLEVTQVSRETHSYVCEEKDVIIGRDDDKRILIDMLVDTTIEADVSVVTIVGIGGLGKTTLAQLVYNDERIKEEFPFKMWVCVSDDFNIKIVLRQILNSATIHKAHHGDIDMDNLQKDLRQALDRKKYLLVLDDVWNENSEKWQKLETLLIGGGRGSKILVTTRSKNVASVVGSYRTHELKGLSNEDSWNLFERMTLRPGQHHIKPQLVDIGKEIVGKCANVPLAIRAIGSLLRGKDESRWLYLKNTDLAKIKQDDTNGIVSVLKISYYYLPFHLKSCFRYCAIFPKDYKIVKEDLICLWMAQGFIMPCDVDNFEDAGEEYFKQLLQMCFFQDVRRIEGTDIIISCKMHDLIHDLAKEVAGTEIIQYSTRCCTENTRHIFIDSSAAEDICSDFTKMNKMCSILSSYYDEISSNLRSLVVLSKLDHLRVLSLNYSGVKMLPSEIGKLWHLRYLDVSCNNMLSMLPSSITKLYNLQTLKLRKCMGLVNLPRDLRKLVNLRHLDIRDCWGLTHMPTGMNSMTSLQKLTGFVVSGTRNDGNLVGELGDLKNFINHSHTMEILVVEGGVRYDAVDDREGTFLLKSQHLRGIKYIWRRNYYNADGLLQGLQPHPNLRILELKDYTGLRFPRWGGSLMNLHKCLPLLVKITISVCRRLEHLPTMSQLRHLKFLTVKELWDLEYVENRSISVVLGSRQGDDLVFFPSLEKLVLVDLLELKGWWRSEPGKGETREEAGFHSNLCSFHQLSYLEIRDCRNLTTFPLCPKLEELNFVLKLIRKRNQREGLTQS
ncbi:putative disease resistance protein RGA4 isoform X2 [Spinacia oleracea]|uniref:Disease resistance protein RGA4 isoform X2 n=1 Tax=Spinacia oleracea TaxID=3562 RepID=A0ABM3RFT3_SPIOL|nr:putative disease resistance protein RGA4 isoform X2 [Spinacia oleracea]